MRKAPPYQPLLSIAILFLFSLTSCRNEQLADIPFPGNDSAFVQPSTQPLVFTPSKKFNWVTLKEGRINPSTVKLDLSSLPSKPYDASDFKPFAKPPQTVHFFDFDKLPDTAFSLEKVPAKSLKFKNYLIPPPVLTKVGMVVPKGGITLSVTEWSVALGLQGSGNIMSLIQDKNGIIWIGGEKGLYKFDGEYVQYYSLPPLVSLIEDRAGNIWFMNREGLGMLDLKKGIGFYTELINAPYPRVPKLILDDQGQIWITLTNEKSVDIVNPLTLTYKQLDSSTHISGNYIWGAYEDKEKNIWISTNNGASIINPSRDRIHYLKKVNGLYSDTLRAISGDNKGRVWISFKYGGVVSVNKSAGTITNYGTVFDYENVTALRILPDSADRIWFATNHGLGVIDPERQLVRYFGDSEGIPKEVYLDLLIDRKKRLWIGSLTVGLLAVDQEAKMVYPTDKKTIISIYIDSSGKIWAGSSNDGILILDENKKTSVQINKKEGFNDNAIQSVQEVKGKVWITSNGGLNIIDQAKKTNQHLGKREGLLTDTIYSVLSDAGDNIWITGPSEGIELIDSAKTKIARLSTANGLSDNTITAIKQDRSRKIWVATSGGGVNVIDLTAGTIRYLKDMPGLKDTSNRVLMEDSYGRMWIGTNKGVYIVDEKLGTITTITVKEGLTNNYVSSILEYKGMILVGTHNKVNIIKPAVPAYVSAGNPGSSKWLVSVLANSGGLILTNENSWDVNAVTKNGQYLWGDLGLTVIHDVKAEVDSTATYITGMNIMNQSRSFINSFQTNEFDTLRARDTVYIKGQKPVNTGYVQSSGFCGTVFRAHIICPKICLFLMTRIIFSFQFAQAHLGRPEPVMYSYILLGIDKHWSAFENKTTTDNYLNLPSGNYIFKVRSKNSSGLWGKPAVLRFSITPPWWKTWWAYTLYILTLVGIIWSFIHYRSKQLLRENRVLEDKIQERTKEVKQQAEELSTVNQISQALVSQADLHDLIKLVGDQLRDLFRANIVYIALLDKKTKIINFPYQYGDKLPPLKLGEGLTSKIILSGQPLLINKDVTEKTSSLGVDRVGIPAASYLGVPIPVTDEIIGVLSIQSTEKEENRFAEKDKRLWEQLLRT